MKNREIFQSLSDGEARKGAIGASIGLHGITLLFLLLFPILAQETLKTTYRTTILAPPPPPPERQIEPLQIKLVAPKPLPPRNKAEPEISTETLPVAMPKPATAPAPPPEIRTVPKPVAPAVAASIPASVVNPTPAPVLPPPGPPVVTNVFSSTVSKPAVTVPVRTTESAGFDDTKVKAETSRTVKSEVQATAEFGDVQGARGSSGGVAARRIGSVGGFDVGVAEGSRSGSGRAGTVLAAGFGSAADTPKPSPTTSKAAEPARNEKPVEIVHKPRPDYTNEARKMRVEGEVLLRVLFTASGETRVLEMTRGLGFGLDENAIRAAEQIRFKPAQRAGQPIDSTAIVHIVFQLAY